MSLSNPVLKSTIDFGSFNTNLFFKKIIELHIAMDYQIIII